MSQSYTGMPQPLKLAFLRSLQRLDGDDFGLADAADDLNDALDAFWPLYADKGRFSPRLQYLYAKRDGVDWLRQWIFDKTTFTEAGVQQADTDAFKALADLREDMDKDIATLETQLRAGQGPAVAQMTTTQIGPVPPIGPNPGDTRYLGDPLKSLFYFPR